MTTPNADNLPLDYFEEGEIITNEDIKQYAMLAIQDDDDEALKNCIYDPTNPGPMKIIKENTSFQDSKETVLFTAILRFASNCVHMLINAPYYWNPDRLTNKRWTPMQMAVDFYSFATAKHMGTISQEKRPIAQYLPKLVQGGNVCELLVWPQDFTKRLFEWLAFSGKHDIGAVEQLAFQADSIVYQTYNPPENLNLIMELYMATPFLFNFQIWTGMNNAPTSNQFWPVPVIPSNSESDSSYPKCLDVFKHADDTREAFEKFIHEWLYYRFRCDQLKSSAPPSLRSFCRAVIRCSLVQNMVHKNTDTNYFSKVSQLGLPNAVEDFLSYSDLWMKRNWPDSLFNIEYKRDPKDRICKQMTLDGNESGYLTGWSFIPSTAAAYRKEKL